jgi:hypothetical protein
MSLALSGKNNLMFGRKHSEETIVGLRPVVLKKTFFNKAARAA